MLAICAVCFRFAEGTGGRCNMCGGATAAPAHAMFDAAVAHCSPGERIEGETGCSDEGCPHYGTPHAHSAVKVVSPLQTSVECYGIYRKRDDENDAQEYFHSALWHNETAEIDGDRIIKGRFVPDAAVLPQVEDRLCPHCNSKYPLHDLECPVAIAAAPVTRAPPQAITALAGLLYDFEALEGVIAWLKTQELTVDVGEHGCLESSAGWLLRLCYAAMEAKP